jgi:Skp family chaperone for outer membrane proteins
MTSRSAWIGTVLAALLASSLALAASDATIGAATPETARASLAKWVETQQLISKEKQDWQQGRQILQSRIAAVNGEIAVLEKRLAETRRTAADVSGKKAGEVAENESLQRAGSELATWVAALESGLRTLETRLPPPLLQKVKPLYDRMPAGGGSTNVSLAERYQNVVGILNEVGRFNNDITMVTEVRTLSDGKPAEVRTVYVGLAQAYFVSPKGDAGIGRPGESGWSWTLAREIAPQIEQVVEVLQNKAKPGFVSLPVKVQ